MIRGALASRYGISPLGRGVIRPASGGWWLSGGIAAANCIAAYQPKGAADYAASKVNLANPGTFDLSNGATYPTWDTSVGWSFVGAKVLNSTFTAKGTNKAYSIIARIDGLTSGDTNLHHFFGVAGTSLDSLNLTRQYSTKKLQWNSSGYFINSDATESGNVIMAISGSNPYLDGTDKGTISNASNIANDGWKIGSTGTFIFVAGAIYDITLDATQVGLLTTAMAAL